MNTNRFLVAVLIISLIGAVLFPLIGVYLPKIRETCDWAGNTIIAILVITLLKIKNK